MKKKVFSTITECVAGGFVGLCFAYMIICLMCYDKLVWLF